MFNGFQAHEVMPFKGYRISFVWFASRNSWDIDEQDKELRLTLADLGFCPPETAADCDVGKWFPVAKGYPPGRRRAHDTESNCCGRSTA